MPPTLTDILNSVYSDRSLKTIYIMLLICFLYLLSTLIERQELVINIVDSLVNSVVSLFSVTIPVSIC